MASNTRLGLLPGILLWIALVIATAVPLAAALMSPLLEWRSPVYILAGFSGVLALCLLLYQPLLARGFVPGFQAARGRTLHRWVGAALIVSVIVHVAGLWITSPPDVVDALLFVSATPFSVWGVIAMWALFASGCLAALRLRVRIRPRHWRLIHKALAFVIVTGSIVHAWMIEGTMEVWSKSVLCMLIGLVSGVAFFYR